MLDKVARLLRKSEDPGATKDEAVTLQEKAFALMAAYGISEALARARQDGLDIKTDEAAASAYVHFTGKYQEMQAELFWALCEPLHCRAVRFAHKGRPTKMRVYGMPDHLKRLRDMWQLLAPQAQRGMDTVHPGQGASPAEVAIARRSWLTGYAFAISVRIEKAEDAAAAAEGALVLYKSDQERAEEAMRGDNPNLEPYHSERSFDDTAYDQGERAGASAELHRSVTE
jgi:Protein of unknown function (DUF2786)